ncbi:glucan biosynthesis protein [Oceaniglobus indicus]|uniref:glucan biosynthesis protein n=1 Tax=Oceaniglobus indicus TaxID=2047749 RepID=UPI001F4D411F|nr:glucan biosynthesis protein G [Oceaniglobus indicus]
MENLGDRMTLNRRTFIAACAAFAAATRPGQAYNELVSHEAPFSVDWLRAEAERLSQSRFQPAPMVPEAWRNLSYDEARLIWFRSDRAIWHDEPRPLQLDLFAAGHLNERPVEVNLVVDGTAKTLAFDRALFDATDKFPDPPIDATMGYSGIRLRTPLDKPEIFREFMVFQGASYFRAIGNGQIYGLSARGLALRTGDEGGEEFPTFSRFYVEAADPGDTTFVVHALLDGPSVTGAYSFEITPGLPTRVGVTATLFPRVDLDHVGLAPLTSMFLFDETNRHRFDDFRPAVHDSDGLLMLNGNGERLWRPLANPRTLEFSSFVDSDPKGFGLMQRTRDPEAFADLEAKYEARPSLWITPRGDWGEGAVRLVEIPADKEIYDNTVAYWRPRDVLAAGQRFDFAYDMAWGDDPAGVPDVARVINTRIGKGFDQVRVVCAIDFEDHPALAGDPDTITLYVNDGRGLLSPGILQRNPGTGGLRASFSFDPEGAGEIEMRVQLLRDGLPLSEVWLYRWTT